MDEIPKFFIYGEPERPIDIDFLHVEMVMERFYMHSGRVRPHKHEQMAQITFWLSGSGTYFVEDKELNFFAPAVSFIPSNVVHGFNMEPGSDALVVSIADGALPAIAALTSLPLNMPVMLTDEKADPGWQRLETILNMVREEYHSNRPEMAKVILPMLAIALSYIFRFTANSASSMAPITVVLAGHLRDLIDRQFQDDCPVEFYSKTLGTTSYLLGKASRDVFGVGVKALINERRLLEAKRLLLFTERTVEDIGFEVGLKDAAYFSRFFKKRTGQSPTQWRSAHHPSR